MTLYLAGFARDGMHHDIHWFNWDTFPVFFGMVTGSFEGIGLVSSSADVS